MADRVALYLQDAHSLRDAIEYVKYAEARGFEAVWQAESRLVRDAVVPMAAFAAVTSRIKIGSGVINNWTRNAAVIAATFLTLDDLAQDRIYCGIGAWWDPLAAKVGIQRRKNLLAMREVVTAVRRLLNRERVTFRGEFVQLDDVELDVVHGRKEPRRVPIYIGATGPKMLALTGEIADGVVLNYLVSPKYNEMAMAQLKIGAKKAGKSVYDIDRPQLVVCSVDEDRQKALDAARKLVTQYLGQQPHIMKASGVSPDIITQAPVFYVRGNHDEMYDEEPPGGVDLHRQIVHYGGLTLAGLEGSIRYNKGKIQYTQSEMRLMVARLGPKVALNRLRYGQGIDLFVTHSPARNIHDGQDNAHRGFDSFLNFMKWYRPRYMLHGHVHTWDRRKTVRTQYEATCIMNINPFTVLELEPVGAGRTG